MTIRRGTARYRAVLDQASSIMYHGHNGLKSSQTPDAMRQFIQRGLFVLRDYGNGRYSLHENGGYYARFTFVVESEVPRYADPKPEQVIEAIRRWNKTHAKYLTEKLIAALSGIIDMCTRARDQLTSGDLSVAYSTGIIQGQALTVDLASARLSELVDQMAELETVRGDQIQN